MAQIVRRDAAILLMPMVEKHVGADKIINSFVYYFVRFINTQTEMKSTDT